MPSSADITDAVHRYIGLIAKGSAADIAALYAADAIVEDPVGGERHIGRAAVHGFYAAIENLERTSELVSLRVAGNEAAFQFRLIITNDGHRMQIEPIDVMVFNDDVQVTDMKAYWSPENVTML